MAILLHIGASKCGSSALQTALTASPTVKRRDGSFVNYAAFDLQHGTLVDKEAMASSLDVRRYKISPNAKDILASPLKKIRKKVEAYPTDLLFSSEGWLFEPNEWSELLKHLDIDVDVVVYVRPQVPVLNSAWWQWGAWSDIPFGPWMAHRLEKCMWGAHVKRWANLERVQSLTVRPVASDIVHDFYTEVLGADAPQNVARPNPSLPGPILRLFQRNRSLRRSPHESRIDFALGASLSLDDPPIWVMDEPWVQRVIDRTKEDTELLMSFMDRECAQSVRDDPRWWSPKAYSDKAAESPDPQPISSEKLEEMCVEMARAIFRLSS